MRAELLTRQARKRARMTLRELAERAGTSDATLSAYQTGAKDPRSSTLFRVLAAAGTEPHPIPVRPSSHRCVNLLCGRIASLVADDPGLLERARAVLPRLEGRSAWVHTWRAVLDAGPLAVIGVLTSTSPDVSRLKTDNPFALLGLIPEHERLQLLELAYET